MRKTFTLTNLLLLLVLLGLVSLGQSISHLEESFKSTRLEAKTASTLVRYWLPPLSLDRVSCSRCHKG